MPKQISGSISALLILGLAACTAQVATAPTPTTEEATNMLDSQPLSDALIGAWTLVKADGIDVRAVLLDFTAQGYNLNAGCNSMGGTASLVGADGLKIDPGMSTLMGCPDNYESEVLTRLTETARFDLSDTQLTLTNSKGEALVFERPPAAEQISGEWTVLSLNMNGGVVSSVDQPDQRIIFETGTFSGSDGCNRVGGTYTITGDTVSFSEMFSTRKACRWQDGKAWDRAYQDALHNAQTLSWRGQTVELRDETGALLMQLKQ